MARPSVRVAHAAYAADAASSIVPPPSPSEPPVVHLLDGHVYVFRAFHSMPELPAPDGTPTGAARGFATTLLRYLQESGATHGAVCFDFAQESFRNEIEPAYKAQRGLPPPELEAQFPLCQEVARALGVPVYAAERYEADDLIATLATRLAGRGSEVVVVTSDKDLAQLVREDGRIRLHDLARGEDVDADGVRRRFAVSPEQIPDWLALVGDSVDNLPGVPGIGPRTAAALLSAFGSLDGIPEDPEAWARLGVRGARRLAGRFAEHRDRAFHVRELATVEREVPGLRASLDALRLTPASPAVVEPLFARLGWRGLRDRVLGG